MLIDDEGSNFRWHVAVLNSSLELCKGWEGVWSKLCSLKMRNLKLREYNQLPKVQRPAETGWEPYLFSAPKVPAHDTT